MQFAAYNETSRAIRTESTASAASLFLSLDSMLPEIQEKTSIKAKVFRGCLDSPSALFSKVASQYSPDCHMSRDVILFPNKTLLHRSLNPNMLQSILSLSTTDLPLDKTIAFPFILMGVSLPYRGNVQALIFLILFRHSSSRQWHEIKLLPCFVYPKGGEFLSMNDLNPRRRFSLKQTLSCRELQEI